MVKHSDTKTMTIGSRIGSWDSLQCFLRARSGWGETASGRVGLDMVSIDIAWDSLTVMIPYTGQLSSTPLCRSVLDGIVQDLSPVGTNECIIRRVPATR